MKSEIPKLGDGIFTTGDVARILGISTSRASYLLREYSGKKFKDLSNFSYLLESDRVKAVNFYGLIELKVLDALRKEGLSTKRILQGYHYYMRKTGSNYPFAKRSVLYSGSEVIFEKDERNLVTTDGSESSFIYGIIKDFTKKIEFDRNDMALRLFPLGKKHSIVVDPQHQFGSPTIKGTNIKTSTLYSHYLGGDNIEFIAKIFSLQPAQVKEAIKFNERKEAKAA